MPQRDSVKADKSAERFFGAVRAKTWVASPPIPPIPKPPSE